MSPEEEIGWRRNVLREEFGRDLKHYYGLGRLNYRVAYALRLGNHDLQHRRRCHPSCESGRTLRRGIHHAFNLIEPLIARWRRRARTSLTSSPCGSDASKHSCRSINFSRSEDESEASDFSSVE